MIITVEKMKQKLEKLTITIIYHQRVNYRCIVACISLLNFCNHSFAETLRCRLYWLTFFLQNIYTFSGHRKVKLNDVQKWLKDSTCFYRTDYPGSLDTFSCSTAAGRLIRFISLKICKCLLPLMLIILPSNDMHCVTASRSFQKCFKRSQYFKLLDSWSCTHGILRYLCMNNDSININLSAAGKPFKAIKHETNKLIDTRSTLRTIGDHK